MLGGEARATGGEHKEVGEGVRVSTGKHSMVSALVCTVCVELDL